MFALRAGCNDDGFGMKFAAVFNSNLETIIDGSDAEHIFVHELSTKFCRLLPTGGDHLFSTKVKDTAEIFNMMVKQAALGLFSQDQRGYFSSGGMDGGLQPGGSCPQDDDIKVLVGAHWIFSFHHGLSFQMLYYCYDYMKIKGVWILR